MTETTMQTQYDPDDAAMAATGRTGPRTVFGELQVETWPCVLQKGVGRVPFDPTQHSIDERRTAIEMCLIPLRGQYNVERKVVAESHEWVQIILPSLKALGVDIRSIRGRFVSAVMVGTGRQHTRAAADGSMETREYTTFKFTAVYPDSETCQEAANAFYRRSNDLEAAPVVQGTPTPAGESVADRHAAALPSTNKERETAAKFLPALWKLAGGDVLRLQELIQKNPLTSKHFDIDSVEVLALIQQQP